MSSEKVGFQPSVSQVFIFTTAGMRTEEQLQGPQCYRCTGGTIVKERSSLQPLHVLKLNWNLEKHFAAKQTLDDPFSQCKPVADISVSVCQLLQETAVHILLNMSEFIPKQCLSYSSSTKVRHHPKTSSWARYYAVSLTGYTSVQVPQKLF